jgi:hypothetical protein
MMSFKNLKEEAEFLIHLSVGCRQIFLKHPDNTVLEALIKNQCLLASEQDVMGWDFHLSDVINRLNRIDNLNIEISKDDDSQDIKYTLMSFIEIIKQEDVKKGGVKCYG